MKRLRLCHKNIIFSFVLVLVCFTNADSQMRQIYSEPAGTNNEIQKISFYSPTSGYIASTDNSADWVGFTSDSGRTIIKRYITLGNVNYNNYNVNLTFGFGLKGVKAFNQDTIVVWGDYGWVPAILYSTNGGQSYLLVYHSQYNPWQLSGGITDAVFPQNDGTGFAVDADRILKTTNKGQSWFVVRTDPDSYYDFLEAVDNNNVFAFSSAYNASKLVKTTNGGQSWTNLSVPSNSLIYYSTFRTPNNGWLNIRDANDSLRLYYTSNGGTSWTQKNHCLATPFFCYKMKFVNDSTGYSIGNGFDTYKTTDSGKVWQPLPRDNNFEYLGYGHNELSVYNQTQLWCGGMKDFLEISTNGGGTPIPKAFFIIDTAGVAATNIVKLINYSKPNYQYSWIVNNVQGSTSYNATYTHNIFSQVDSIELIVTSNGRSDTLKRYQYFSVPNLPTVSSFTPTSGSTGTYVLIRGNHFTGVTSVKCGGTPASTYAIVSDTVITAIVASGSSGPVTVSNNFGGFSLPYFTYFAPPSSPAPIITGFTPVSGLIGTNVTITGAGFGAAPSNNIVYFGATRASIISASATQISCTVPAGASYEPISVLNTSTNLTGRSLKPFGVLFNDSSNFTPSSYREVLTFNYSNYPKHVAGKDLDADGKPDLITVITAINGDSVVAYRNTTNGSNFSFGPRKNIGLIPPYTMGMFDINDLDGDGKPDIVAITNDQNLAVIRNTSATGTLSFANQINVTCGGGGTQNAEIADFDNDGKPDIAAATFSSARMIAVVRNTSSPGYFSFGPPLNFNTADIPVQIAVGDLDGDGKNDIVSYNYSATSASTFSAFRNITTGNNISFAPHIDFGVVGTSVQARTVRIADYDDDNKLDVIIMNDNNYSIYRNTSSGTTIAFAAPITVTVPFPQGSWVSNLSGDMKPDLLLGSAMWRHFSLVRNTSVPGAITNDAPIDIEGNPNNTLPYYTNAADFNMDGKIDIISSGSNDRKLTIFRNAMGTPIIFSGTYFCPGMTRSHTSDITGTSYQWQLNTGSGFTNISNNATYSGTQTSTLTIASVPYSFNGYIYRCIVNGNLYSSLYVLVMNPSAPPSVSISTPTTSICYGTSVQFTATGTNTGPATSYGWQVNGVFVPNENGPTFTTTTLTNGSTVRGYLSNFCSTPNEAFSNIITMTVTGQPATVSISASQTIVCTGTSVTFSSTVTNPGPSPIYQWKVNGVNAGTNSPTFTTSSLTNGAQVSLTLTTAATSCGTNPPVTSNIITMTVSNPVTPSVSVVANPNPFCQGGFIIFTATPVNGGPSPSYQWQRNGINFGGNTNSLSTGFLNNGDLVQVIMTSNANCPVPPTATSNTITVSIINTVVPVLSISGSTTVNSGQSTTITAVPTNGGTVPAYQWQDSTNTHTWQNISGATNSTLVYLPASTGNKIRCILTSNANCASPTTATSNTLTFTVNTVTGTPPAPVSSYNIRYYPNPVHSTLFIDSLRLSDKWQTLDIIGINSNKVLVSVNISNRRTATLNVERLSSGQYMAVLRRKNGSIAYLKFIKL
ncbi:MAG: VCBS repeat-containing protein [Sphingobacteriales bacterium]|nr:VCBS repeat-containing protein [Sphingobacteriales bacterium]